MQFYRNKKTPKNDILVTAGDMNNLNDFATSRAIVAELYAEKLEDRQALHLQQAHRRFMDTIHNKINAREARYAPHQTTMLGHLSQR